MHARESYEQEQEPIVFEGKTNSEYKKQEKMVCIDHTIQFVQNSVDLNAVELI